MSNSWPAGIPETLWNYRLLQEQIAPQIPMMGIYIAPQFLYSFAIGCAFIGYFAWDRFKKRRTETDAFNLRIMKEVGVAELGGTGALRRAYLLYVTTLMALYVAMTFFGKLIFQTLNTLNVAGIQVDSTSLKFDSPQWPLLLAFGLAGLAPLVMPLRVAEDWLFARAYRAVGIPVRIQQTTRNFVDILDSYADELAAPKGSAGDAPPARAGSSLAQELERKRHYVRHRLAGTWAEAVLDSWAKEDETLAVFSELLLLVDWAKGGRGSWPGPEVSDEVRKLEQTLVGEAETLLGSFLDQLEPQEKKSSDKALAQRKVRLAGYVRDALVLRNEFLAVLAVYAERDPTYVGTEEESATAEPGKDTATSRRITVRPALRELLGKATPPNQAGSGPEGGLLLCLVPVFLLYAIFTWQGSHPAISQSADPSNWRTVLATAGFETLKVVAIVWLPLVAAFAVRQMYYDRGAWARSAVGQDRSAWTEQRVVTTSIATAIAVVGLVGVALLQSFLIAPSVARFQSLLFSGGLPTILFLPTLALVSVPIVHAAIWGADVRARGDSSSWIGMLCAACVIAALAGQIAFWFGDFKTCTGDAGTFLLDMFSPGCFKYYGGLDFFIYPVLGFLATAVFGTSSRSELAAHRAERRLGPRDASGLAATALTVLLLATGTFAASQAALADDGKNKTTVRIGFRIDAEPFSYRYDPERLRTSPPAHQRQYGGFIADICYYIFDQGNYQIDQIPVTAVDRFSKLKDDEIDVLCDPVTLRYSEPDRAEAGAFSPIVFASTVTYLENRKRDRQNNVFIAYVANTTANLVVKHACDIDLITAIPYDQRSHLPMMCATAEALRQIEDLRLRGSSAADPDVAKAAQALAAATKNEHLFAADEVKGSKPADRKRKQDLASLWESREMEASRIAADCRRDGCSWSQVGDRLQGIVQKLGPSCGDLDLPSVQQDKPGVAQEASLPNLVAQQKDEKDLLTRFTHYRFCPQATHDAAIRWMCERRFGDPAKESLVYLGDRDIILGKLRSWNNANPKCVVTNENGAESLTYEPYAIMVSDKADNAFALLKQVQRRVHDFFSFRSRARAVFDTYFPQTTGISPTLAYLFLLNATEEERDFLYPTPEAAGQKENGSGGPAADPGLTSQAGPARTDVAANPRRRRGGASGGRARPRSASRRSAGCRATSRGTPPARR